ncbi:hypothetical protein C8F04DRAFT_1274120 [Mycena alexandri]|uniref:Uncharacterized protein n=1 Tax=Mycena alexandri TaxID=1745969 RepID=A0AAD6WU76_9AGAR|nr:hypothetical protein C8F04DRAFT_1274120 [Mycena alexandri]
MSAVYQLPVHICTHDPILYTRSGRIFTEFYQATISILTPLAAAVRAESDSQQDTKPEDCPTPPPPPKKKKKGKRRPVVIAVKRRVCNVLPSSYILRFLELAHDEVC